MFQETSSAAIRELPPRTAQVPDACQPYHCQLAGRLVCYESIDDSAAYERLDQAAQAFQDKHRAAEATVAHLKQDWFSYIEEKDTGDRSDRRHFRRTKERQFSGFSHDSLREVQRTLETQLEPGWDASPLTLDGRKSFSSFFSKLDKKERPPKFKTHARARESIVLFDTHYTLATSQLRARGELAMFYADAPNEAKALFHPDNWGSLPPALQHLAALDISKGENSVILNRQFSEITDDPAISQGDRLAQYLAANGISKEAKAFFKAVQIGAAATGAIACPFNEFGLCLQVLERIELSELPSQILADIKRREQFGNRTDKLRLEQLSKSVPLGLFDPQASTVGVLEAEPLPEKQSHKRQKSAEIIPDIEESAQDQEISNEPTKLQIHLMDGLNITVDSQDAMAFDRALDQLLSTKLFGEYMAKHNFKGMNEFMRECLAAILNSDSQREGSGIKTLTDAQPLYHDGDKLRLCELAVDKHRGLPGGRVAQRTRIFFAKGSSVDSRKILLLSVAQKEDVKKENLTHFFKRR